MLGDVGGSEVVTVVIADAGQKINSCRWKIEEGVVTEDLFHI